MHFETTNRVRIEHIDAFHELQLQKKSHANKKKRHSTQLKWRGTQTFKCLDLIILLLVGKNVDGRIVQQLFFQQMKRPCMVP